MHNVVVETVRLHADGGDQADNRERDQRSPERRYQSLRSLAQVARGLDREPKRAVQRKRYERDESADDGVPVEYSRMHAWHPVSPERQEEVSVGLERYATDHVGQRRTKEDSQQQACDTEKAVEQRLPHAHIEVVAKLQAYAAHDQQPEHDHQRQVESAEG